MSRRIHVVSFDVPFPPDYGGVIDVYYKLKWLKERGIAVVLHCFTYGRQPSPYLEELCEAVHYYPRNTGIWSNFSVLPYTVASRRSRLLLERLTAGNDPVLFEVLHTCLPMKDARLHDHKKIYRHSNIEHDYYNMLSKSEKSPLRRLYLRLEAMRLKRFERIVAHADLVLAVNRKDTAYFAQKFPGVRSLFLPSFHPYDNVQVLEGNGEYVLFHANLSISENYESACWLIDNVFSQIVFNVVIAGKQPPAFLRRKIAAHRNIRLVADPSGEKMDELIANAQIHCLHTHQPTGLKLKLLHVLFRGRFVIANHEMIEGTGLHDNATLIIAGTANEYVSQINRVFNTPFTAGHVVHRESITEPFRNQHNIDQLIAAVWP